MDKKIKLLFVDDEEKFLKSTAERLTLRGLEVFAYTNGQDALDASEQNRFDVAVLDLKMPGIDGEELLQILKEKHPTMEVVILTGHGSIDSAVRSTQQGAYEYLQKPCQLDDLISVISRAYAKRIQAVEAHKAAKVEEVLKNAMSYSPLGLLEALKKIDKE